MSLLDDARRLVEAGPGADDGEYAPWCIYCHVQLFGNGYGSPPEPHKPDCPWLSMPKIVAALEAAQVVVDTQFAAWCAHADSINDLAEAMQDDKG